MYILLNSVEKLKEFVNGIEKFQCDLNLVSGMREVYAKSLLGIFSLDLTKPIEVKVLKMPKPIEVEELLTRYAP